jgi:serine/threonine protein kinase
MTLRNFAESFRSRNLIMPLSVTMTLACLLTQLVADLHRLDFSHGDLNPECILLAQEDGKIVLKLVVTSLRRLDEDGSVRDTFGSSGFKAPERARGEAHSVALADSYSLGRLVIYMMTLEEPSGPDTIWREDINGEEQDIIARFGASLGNLDEPEMEIVLWLQNTVSFLV